MHRLSRILLIINLKSMIIMSLAILSTYLCIKYDVTANFPLTLITTSIIFPIVFSIGGAYKRREAALDKYGTMKAHGRAIYFVVRDWLDNPSEEDLKQIRKHMGDLFFSCRNLFTQPTSKLRENEDHVYRNFSDISKFIRTNLREGGLSTGEVSRCNQYLSKMFNAFEGVKHVYQYRTPRTLQAFSDFFIALLPPLYGPYFAHISHGFTPGTEYIMPILLSLILVSLDNIQEHLENPFDQVGEDDITINAEEFVRRLN